jgi:hypothetical protein
MRHLRILLFAATAGLLQTPCGSLPAAAQSPPTTETAAADELFDLLFENLFVRLNAQAVEQTWPSLESALRANNPGVDAGRFADLRREFEAMRLRLLRDLLRDTPAIYERHLSAAEMRDVIAFYRTPSGARMLQVVPKVMGEMFVIMLPGLQRVMVESQDAFLQTLRARGELK